ncbi:MAG: metallophosphoesterase [Deltaproteobacteria bacterium]|nr:metallophosphoesterase [Deltaproteobacteria bacterium]
MIATGYGFVAARQINVEWVYIPTIKLNKMSEPFRIVQISDLHIGLLSNEKRLRRLVETIESIHPDVVVSTGDLIDMQLDVLIKVCYLQSGLVLKCFRMKESKQAASLISWGWTIRRY